MKGVAKRCRWDLDSAGVVGVMAQAGVEGCFRGARCLVKSGDKRADKVSRPRVSR